MKTIQVSEPRMDKQVLSIIDAETEIRRLVKNGYLYQTPYSALIFETYKIIDRCLLNVNIQSLRDATRRSLLAFFQRQYSEISKIGREKILILALLLSFEKTNIPQAEISLGETAVDFLLDRGIGYAPYGTPLRKFVDDYINNDILPTIEQMAKEYALDPDDVSGRNSLFARAELEVRYNAHLKAIEELRANGTRLVICSTHADCSKRCSPWQGRVYSLDGTYGVTSDGRKYVPLEIATDIYYTTKAGITYKNGLLGFNCRHYLVPYKHGFSFPMPSVDEERKQYKITQKQRLYERMIRQAKARAVMYDGISRVKYAKAKADIRKYTKAYIEFSKSNKRAYYLSRTKI